MWRTLGLGVLQGLTEFLPVSSSGHLVVFKNWFRLSSPGTLLEVSLHLGTLLSILFIYRRPLWKLFLGVWTRRPNDLRLFWMLMVASAPAGLLGFLLEEWVGSFFVPSAVVVGWLITSSLLWFTPSPHKGTRQITAANIWDALQIGIFQALALWPGLSRSGSTIFMARHLDFTPDAAAQFSFFMAIPVIGGASILTLMQYHGDLLSGRMGFAVLTAAIIGSFALKWVKRSVARPWMWRSFSFYTAGMAILALIVRG